MNKILNFSAPPIDKREILRYAGAKDDAKISELLDNCLEKCQGVLNYNVCFCELKFTIYDDMCDFGDFSVHSTSLAENLKNARRVFLFVASVGLALDRLIAKASRTSPLAALIFSAIGTERVEALADAFTEWIAGENSLVVLPRFSAGYGDLPLSLQKEIFEKMRPEKQIGVFLSDDFIMSPSKSVTAFVGLK